MRDLSLPEGELETLKFWRDKDIFQKSLDTRKDCPLFVFNDGPPFATGLPHYGHLLASTIKDTVLRYKTMRGFYVPRRFGWDCHGLPIENEIEKEKNLSGASSIEEYGIAKFNEACRSIVMRYSAEWKKTITRVGRWVDFDQNWHTMDPSFMESVWWTFKELWEKDFVYEGFKVMPFSPALGTPLSNFEATSNYKEVDDPSIVIEFELDSGERALVWTTTPWTLPANMALAVHPDLEYAVVEAKGPQSKESQGKKKYIVALDLIERHFGEPNQAGAAGVAEKPYTILKTLKGSVLANKTYKPLFSFFDFEKDNGAFKIIAADYVGATDGTGIVHISPAHGEDDFYAAKEKGIPLVCAIDNQGIFTSLAPEFKGLFVKDADKPIIRALKDKGNLFSQKTLHHRYPFCWRTDTPLIYKAHATWFVAVEKFKDKMLSANEKIHWTPQHIQKGRFGKWLEGARDWAVSRNRFWGTPIPIWRSDEGDFLVIGSVEELEKKSGRKVEDLHRHFIDDIEIKHEGKTYKRVPEVFDCWFESGSMPWAKRHYPFSSEENNKEFEAHHPADFIAEGLDQTRGWFYTLTALSAALFDKPPVKNVIVNGILLAEDGNKMSKRLKNYPEPEIVMDKSGADSLRLYLLGSPAAHADDMRFSQQGVETVMRQVLIPLWNAFKFYDTYAQIYNVCPEGAFQDQNKSSSVEIDRWVLSAVESLAKEVMEALDDYKLPPAIQSITVFIEKLTNWYIRRSRGRFWADEDSEDRRSAFKTLYEVLVTTCQILASITPFLSERIYRALKTKEMPESVHLCEFPSNTTRVDSELEKKMYLVQEIVGLGHSLRKEEKIKVRQPLAKAWIVAPKGLEAYSELIAEELNVKEVEFTEDAGAFVTVSLEPNFRVLGKKVGPLMKEVKVALAELPPKQVEAFIQAQNTSNESPILTIEVSGQTLELTSEDVQIKRTAKGELASKAQGVLSVAYDTELTQALLEEGFAREFVNKINTLRRETGLEVTDRIEIVIETSASIEKAFESHREYITHETLTIKVAFAPCKAEAWDLGAESVKIAITKAAYEKN